MGFITGCLADRRASSWAAWVSLPVVWPGWIAGRAPTGRTGPAWAPPAVESLVRRGIPGVFRPKRNDERREATRSAGMDRRPNAAWVSSPAVWPGWIAGRAPTGRTGPRGFHETGFVWPGWIAGRAPTGRTGPRGFPHRPVFGRDGSPDCEPPPGMAGLPGSHDFRGRHGMAP